jgi:hypothetical protein
LLGGAFFGHGAQAGVGRHAAADDQVGDTVLLAGPDRLAGEHVDDRLLERGGHVADRDRAFLSLYPAGNGGLQPGEGEVQGAVIGLAAREIYGVRIAFLGRLVDRRAAGERQAEHPGHLVVGLAGRVVDRRAERLHVAGDVADQQQRGVPAGHQQGHRLGGQRAVLQLVHGDVRGQVVNPVQRLAEGERVRLGGGHPDQQGPLQARSGGNGDGVDLGGGDTGLGERALEGRDHRLQVRPAGHLGHHTAEPRVFLDTGSHRVGQQFVPADQSDAGLIAGGLDAQNERAQWSRSFRMTIASTPAGW